MTHHLLAGNIFGCFSDVKPSEFSRRNKVKPVKSQIFAGGNWKDLSAVVSRRIMMDSAVPRYKGTRLDGDDE